MKSSIITNETSQRHFVQNYRFKVLLGEHTDSSAHAHSAPPRQSEPEIAQQPSTPMPASEPMLDPMGSSATPAAQSKNDSFVEELLKKVDEMGDNVIKLQMQIENQESEFNARLASETERARAEGEAMGEAKAKDSLAKELQTLKTQYSASVSKLNDAALALDKFIAKNEAELGSAAIEIAKEVIAKELKQNSADIAISLAKGLLSELNSANKITLSANPDDAGFLKDALSGDTRINILADDAIAKGGVIITSDAGNLEANLSQRLEKLKTMVG